MLSFISFIQNVPRNSEHIYEHPTAVFWVVTNSFPGSSLAAAAACYRGGFHVKSDTCTSHMMEHICPRCHYWRINGCQKMKLGLYT
jgi:hypothetical protein